MYTHVQHHSKIAWSRFGCIANIAAHGRRLDLRLLIRSPKTGDWRLQKPNPVRLAYPSTSFRLKDMLTPE